MRAVNLLTPELRTAPEGKGSSEPAGPVTPGGIGAFVLLGALALIVAGLAGYVLSNNTIKERKVALAQVSSRSAATVAKAHDLKPYADFETVAKNRAGTVQALAAARFDWEQALRDISRAMPHDVALSALDGNVGAAASGTGTVAGGTAAGGAQPGAASQSPSIDLKGCTKSQTAVATLMSRMRTVEGVTRVTLAKSDKGQGAAGAAASTPAAAGAAGPAANSCGKGSPPTFEMVIFFEHSAVAKALSSATGVATSTGASATTGGTR